MIFKKSNAKKWEELLKRVSEKFNHGEIMDVQDLIYLIGIQELGIIKKKFKKDEKIDLMHIAVCRLLEPYGYYEFEGKDNDRWPHYRLVHPLPKLKPGEQSVLIKEAILNYFDQNDAFDEL